MVSVPSQVSTSRRLQFGPFEADFHSGELRKNGQRLRLQAQPFQLLAMLLERPGELVIREGNYTHNPRNRSTGAEGSSTDLAAVVKLE